MRHTFGLAVLFVAPSYWRGPVAAGGQYCARLGPLWGCAGDGGKVAPAETGRRHIYVELHCDNHSHTSSALVETTSTKSEISRWPVSAATLLAILEAVAVCSWCFREVLGAGSSLAEPWAQSLIKQERDWR
jgi:hypothetical protein